MNKTIIAYYQGIEVMILPEKSFRKEKRTIIAAIVKTNKGRPNDVPLPKEVPLDNLSFPKGTKCQTMKLMTKLLKPQNKKDNQKTLKNRLSNKKTKRAL